MFYFVIVFIFFSNTYALQLPFHVAAVVIVIVVVVVAEVQSLYGIQSADWDYLQYWLALQLDVVVIAPHLS